jgi:small subunit ribosomal protein S21
MDKRFDKKRDKNNIVEGRYVKVYDNNIDKALRILKRKVNNDNTLKLLREREFFVSRGERRRKEKVIATRRYARKVEKANLERSSPPKH